MKPPLTHLQRADLPGRSQALQRAAQIMADMQQLRIDLVLGDSTQLNTHLVVMMDVGKEAMSPLFTAATMWDAPKAGHRRAVRA